MHFEAPSRFREGRLISLQKFSTYPPDSNRDNFSAFLGGGLDLDICHARPNVLDTSLWLLHLNPIPIIGRGIMPTK